MQNKTMTSMRFSAATKNEIAAIARHLSRNKTEAVEYAIHKTALQIAKRQGKKVGKWE